ncbi:hypothetical protein AAA420_11410 [Lactobacillus crispatus]|uniref:hypothetical protein n=1 Tax=Lactobacillus crispatus TaxID=47770 RepID=UPI0030FD00C2
MTTIFEYDQQQNIIARKKFKNKLKKILSLKTNYTVQNSNYDDYTIWFVRKQKDSFSDNLADNLAFSAQISENGKYLEEIHLADKPDYALVHSKDEICDLLDALQVVQDFLWN